MLARRFLWIVAVLVLLFLLGALAMRIWGTELMRMTMVPSAAFEGGRPQTPSAYAKPGMWISRPGMAKDPALWTPQGHQPTQGARASVFFIHPTSYLEKSRWNASVDDAESQLRARLFVRSQASAFNAVGEIWAPKYRQATFGAFLTTEVDAAKALDFAYRDVLAAYETFLDQAPKDRPIILAGHSQGSLHLMRLLAERIAGSPEAKRIAAAYVVGWPISVTADLPGLGLPACRTAGQAGCILSWQSFSEPADTEMVTDVYDASASKAGMTRAGSAMVCTNPLTGATGGEAPAAANLGTLLPNKDFSDGTLLAPGVPARCDARGFLLIGRDVPELGSYVLPGNNYHVYDYALFWANIRADAEARVTSFLRQ